VTSWSLRLAGGNAMKREVLGIPAMVRAVEATEPGGLQIITNQATGPEAGFRAQLEAAPDAMMITDGSGTIQRALMGSANQVPGMRSANRYLPATQGAGVSGDWIDLITLGEGRIGVLIGDVMGRGLEAATVMGQLRSAANALARTGMPPQQLMNALDVFAHQIPDQLTTCCYLVINTDADEVTGCSAGHLPVLLVHPDGTVHELPIPVSVPLGVGGVLHEQATIPVPASATLVLYTDGLVETRDRDIDERISALKDELRAIFTAGPSLEQAADQILSAMLPRVNEPPDDVTLLLVQIPGPAPGSPAATVPVQR
jgi:serine phosphatase RsbU (regulator of sigma subunit)